MDPAAVNWKTSQIISHNLFSYSPYIYARNNVINRFDINGYVDWPKVGIGALGVVSGTFETAVGGGIAAGTGVTVVGAVGGAALMMHGLATIGFSVGQIITGIAEKDTKVPGGPLEAVGEVAEKGVGIKGSSKVGKIMDLSVQILSGGNPATNLKETFDLIPLSATEALKAGNYQLKISKELINLGSQGASAIQFQQTTKDIKVSQKKKKDGTKDK